MAAKIVASVSGDLIIECRTALGLTQQQFGDLVGHGKRTVQRWEVRGAILLPSQLEALACALSPVRPDLAERIASSGETTLASVAKDPGAVASPTEMSEAAASVVRAAANAIGVTPNAVVPAVAAAFARAHELGLEVRDLADLLKRWRST